MTDTMDSASAGAKRGRRRSVCKALPPLIVIAAVGGAVWLIKTKPRPRRRPAAERAVLVRTEPMFRTAEHIMLESSGTVIPARQITLQSRVASEVIELSPEFVPGGLFAEGEVILRLDPEDYRLALEGRRSDVVRAEAAYKIELGQQDIARHEWSLVRNEGSTNQLDMELTLRRPQLQDASAKLAAARALSDRAEINLDRTVVRAPFNAVVRARYVNVGSQVSAQTPLAELAGTDEYWVLVTLPVDRLRWVTLPAEGKPGAAALVRPAGGIESDAEWMGEVIRRLPDLEEEGRLARVLVSVRNPLDSSDGEAALTPPLLGAFVTVTIEGPEIENVFSIPVTALHDGDTIWMLNGESRLELRRVDVLWRGYERVLIRDDLQDGEKLVVTRLGTPVPGMLLREEATPGRDRGERTESQGGKGGAV